MARPWGSTRPGLWDRVVRDIGWAWVLIAMLVIGLAWLALVIIGLHLIGPPPTPPPPHLEVLGLA